MATEADSKRNSDGIPRPETPPLTYEEIFAVTELAVMGHEFLKRQLLAGKLADLDPNPEKAAAMLRHYQKLVEQVGPAAIDTFTRICRYTGEISVFA